MSSTVPRVPTARATSSAAVELGDERFHPGRDVVACGPDFVDRTTLGVFEVPVDVALAGDVEAGVVAAHRDHYVGLFGERGAQPLRAAVGEVDVELAHDLDDRRVHVPVAVGV